MEPAVLLPRHGLWVFVLRSWPELKYAWPPCIGTLTVKYKLEFYISLTVHLGIILVNNQLDALFFLMYLFIYFTSQHVSSNPVLIIRGNELYEYIIWYISLCVGDFLVCRYDRHTRQSPTQSDIYQMMYSYNSFLLMMSTGLLETC